MAIDIRSAARITAASLSLSAAGFIGISVHEYYVGEAMIPTRGDRPTIGFGSTFHEDGTPVRVGEKTTPVRAIVLAGDHIAKEEAKCRDSLPGVSLHQGEYDIYCGDWTYQYGSGAWLKSSMREDLLLGNYWRACHDLLAYRWMNKGKPNEYDCSTLVNGQPNKRCWGVWTRQLNRYTDCMAMQ
jgi:GH24 family phage-related lysozyme (muramidase)